MPPQPWRSLDGPLRFAGNQFSLAVPLLPGGLAGHAAGRVGQRGEPLVSDLSPAILTNAIGTVNFAIPGALGLLGILLENLPDGLGVRPVSYTHLTLPTIYSV